MTAAPFIPLFNSLANALLFVNQDGTVVLANTAAVKLLAADTPSSISQQPVEQVLSRKDWGQNLGGIVMQTLTSRHGKQLLVTSQSGSFYQISLAPVLDGEQLLGVSVLIQDVTEAKHIDQSKDEFLSIASHELRTPLTAIRGNMGMLEEYYPEALQDPNVRSMVEDSHTASIRLIEIVNDFLDSSSLEQGKVVFNLAPVQIAPLAAAIQSDLKVLTEKQDNHLVLDQIEKLPPVMADESRLRQILYNLLSNANKYAEHATITLSGVADDGTVRIRVSDTGKGISPANQKLLFHKFQRPGDASLTRDITTGSGLGLYIARLLAANMHGTVELEHSEEGKGSTFAVVLPIAQAKDTSHTRS